MKTSLSLPERLQLYQLPLLMDLVLQDLDPRHGLPFEHSPPPDLFVSIFQQLWGVSGGGGVSGSVLVETPPCVRMADDPVGGEEEEHCGRGKKVCGRMVDVLLEVEKGIEEGRRKDGGFGCIRRSDGCIRRSHR
jgi:hypothetical protein